MAQEPDFSGQKMKMPAEHFGNVVVSSEPKTAGTLIALLIVALLAILAGLGYWYFLGHNLPITAPTLTRPALEQNAEPETPTATAQGESFSAMSTSDEISLIEADLESTHLESLDSELLQIDAILQEASLE